MAKRKLTRRHSTERNLSGRSLPERDVLLRKGVAEREVLYGCFWELTALSLRENTERWDSLREA